LLKDIPVVVSSSPTMSSAQLKAKMFEKKAREAAEPPGKKDVVW
jgi:hypothetical protein